MVGVEDLGFAGARDLMSIYVKAQKERALNLQTNESTLISQVLDHARRVVAHPTRPTLRILESFMKRPSGEIALEETLDEDPFFSDPEALLVETVMDKPFPCVAMLDCSASMSGDKHLLACIAVAVLLLEVPTRDASVIVFSSGAKTLKSLREEQSTESVLRSFLRAHPRGFTNLASGLKAGLDQYKRAGSRKRKVGLIATDGRATEGEDPFSIAELYDSLITLHLHGPGSHLEGSQQLAQKGHGVCLEVEKLEHLPRRLYDALRWLARI